MSLYSIDQINTPNSFPGHAVKQVLKNWKGYLKKEEEEGKKKKGYNDL